MCGFGVLSIGQSGYSGRDFLRLKSLYYIMLDELPVHGTPRAPYPGMIQLFSSSNPRFWRLVAPAVAGLVLSAGVAEAQRRPTQSGNAQTEQSRRDPAVPKGFAPPAGMCRIWINNVPPGKQPAPRDCASAVRNRPANGKVLFGDDPSKAKGRSKKKSSAADGLVDLITRGIAK